MLWLVALLRLPLQRECLSSDDREEARVNCFSRLGEKSPLMTTLASANYHASPLSSLRSCPHYLYSVSLTAELSVQHNSTALSHMMIDKLGDAATTPIPTSRFLHCVPYQFGALHPKEKYLTTKHSYSFTASQILRRRSGRRGTHPLN